MKFLIAYDIADPKRLRHVAECLERSAQRVQKSVFVFEGSPAELAGIQRQLVTLIDLHEDRIQSWPLTESTATARWDAGQALPSHVLCVIAAPDEVLFLEDKLAVIAAARAGSARPK